MASNWRNVLRSTGFVIFFRNMAQPLYGDYTRSGRIISFFLRVFLLLFLLVWTVLRLAGVVLGFVLHLAALPAILIMIIYQVFSILV